ncbi:AMP-dependent synthetase/ligase [Penicillium capsulatum]|uniref:AMP-dependent synthetase/ligase n=1 Tax=Penicillium capsulatum TaxID=69766 RepID=A0A9W9LVJ8_9EURO|nr:AMP-dependent synthetase/ligase [Penicillium capsulatum]KAJ6123463.1 AMP-dependent synthetase/ligase [Penicillium capsulatum]
MTPILLHSNHASPSGSTSPQLVEETEVIDCQLDARPTSLLRLFDTWDIPSVSAGAHPDVQLQLLLQLAWVITLRPFAASRTLYIKEEYRNGYSFVGESPDETIVVAQIHPDAQETIQGLLCQMVNNLEDDKGEIRKDLGDARLNSTIFYQRQPLNGVGDGNNTVTCAGRCQMCCSLPLAAPSPSQLPSRGLRLYISRTPDNRLHARLDRSAATNIGASLATSLLHTFNKALLSVGTSPTQAIGAVELCSLHDRQWIRDMTRPVAPAQNALLHDLCLRHAQTHPDTLAVRSWDGDLTYDHLRDASSRLAHWLVGQGVHPGVFVACTFYKSTWAIVARLAILMAGGAYICVDAHDPPPYLTSVLERTQSKILLTSAGFGGNFASLVDIHFEVTEASLQILPSLMTVPCTTVTPTDPCVVLFTSGSTGQPKGIVQEHRSYASALKDYIRVTGMGPHSRMFQFDAYAFDISNNDFLAPLMAGGCCCVPTTSLSMDALMTDLNDLQANMMFVTPSVAIDMDPDRMPTLRVMCIGGEPVSDAVLAKWTGRVQVINQYGMGEVASLCAFNPNLQMGRGAVVGRPASGSIWIVNPDFPDQLMPVGAVGELLIEGPHISRGYLDHVSARSENFLVMSPAWMTQLHPNRPSYRFYRSGDLGRYKHDGTIELIGRKDTMLKLDGARVEAGQVEYVLRRHLSTGDAAVVDVLGAIDGVSDPILAVYLYLDNNPMNLEGGVAEDMHFCPISKRHAIHALTEKLSDAVRENLPTYYIPSLFLLVDRVPRTKSKKTDRRKLHMLGQAYYLGCREELRDITVWPVWE